MEWTVIELSFTSMEVKAEFVGSDILICISGGEKPHLGSVVQAVPRPSLSGSGESSCTSSVLNLTGHKDEMLCRRLAEKICRHFQAVTVCTGGFHVENISPEEIQEVLDAMEELENQVITDLERTDRIL